MKRGKPKADVMPLCMDELNEIERLQQALAAAKDGCEWRDEEITDLQQALAAERRTVELMRAELRGFSELEKRLQVVQRTLDRIEFEVRDINGTHND